jgi:glutaredoxin
VLKLYSTGCPNCLVLEKKLKEKGLDYEKIDDINKIQELGFRSVPVLVDNEKVMDFISAIKYITNL